MMSQPIFKSFTHFEYIFVYGVSWWSSFFSFLFSCSCPGFPICWRGYFYSILCSFPLCQILIDHRYMGLFLGSLFWSIELCVHSYASTRLFWLQLSCNLVWYQVLWFLLLRSSFSKLLRLFRVIYSSIKFFEMFVLYLWNMSLIFY